MGHALRRAASQFTSASAPPVAGYAGWWDASDTATVTTSGGAVSQWSDKSTNGLHFVQGTANKQPAATGSQNGRQVIVFDGSNDAMTTGSVALGASTTWFIVATPSTGTNDYLLEHQTPGAQMSLITKFASRAFELYVDGFIGNPRFTIGSGSETGWHQLTVRRATTAYASWIDGATSGTGTGTSSTLTGSLYLGADDTGANFAAVSVAEVIVYASALSPTDRQSVEAYLKSKWGTP